MNQTTLGVLLKPKADVTFGSRPAHIDRVDRARQVTIGGNLQGITSVRGWPWVMPCLPYRTCLRMSSTAGDAEIMADIFSHFLLALGTAVLMIYAVLVLLCDSFLYPFAVMVALLLSIEGVLRERSDFCVNPGYENEKSGVSA